MSLEKGTAAEDSRLTLCVGRGGGDGGAGGRERVLALSLARAGDSRMAVRFWSPTPCTSYLWERAEK